MSNKTEKIRGKGIRRHLLVYNNIYGGTSDLRRLPQLLGNVQDDWDSIWLIAGVPGFGWLALVANSVGLNVSMFDDEGCRNVMPTFWSYWIDRSGLRIFGQSSI